MNRKYELLLFSWLAETMESDTESQTHLPLDGGVNIFYPLMSGYLEVFGMI